MGKQQSKLNPEVLEDLKNITQFREEEIVQWYKGFLKDFPTKQLTIKEFKSMYTNFFPYMEASVFAERVFKTFDINGDGTIDFREFMCAISISSKGSIEEKLERAFKMYDSDGDGFITRGELMDIVISI